MSVGVDESETNEDETHLTEQLTAVPFARGGQLSVPADRGLVSRSRGEEDLQARSTRQP